MLTTILGDAAPAADDTGAPATRDTGEAPSDTGTPAPPPACSLQHDLSSPHLSEGEALRFSVWCGDAEARAAGAYVELLSTGRHGARLRPEGTIEWQTGGADGGRHELVLTAHVPGATGVPETLILPVWVADDPAAAGAVPPEPATYDEEWGLPVVHITHAAALTQEDQPATFTVRGQSVEGEIKIRGATSVAYPKNSFTLDFDSGELEVEEWGPRSRGHLILTSTFDDNSYLRQKLAFDLWAALAETAEERRLAPATFFAVVYRNGVYEGLYLGSDRIDDEHARHRGFGGEGDLFKAVDHDANYGLLDTSGAPKEDLARGWEKKEGVDEDDLSGIRALTAWSGALDPAAVPAEAGDWIDAAAYRDWHLFTMVAFTEDSAGKNHYVYQDDETGRFVPAPWDFNASFGQSWKTTRRRPTQLRDHTLDNQIFALLQAHPDTCAALQARHAALRTEGGPFDPAWQLARIAEYELLIGPSARRDEARWAAEHRSFWRWAEERDEDDDWTDFAGELAYLRDWIPQRAEAVQGWIDGRCTD